MSRGSSWGDRPRYGEGGVPDALVVPAVRSAVRAQVQFIDLTADPNPTCSGIDPNGLASDKLHVAGAAAADFDNDGYVDLFVSWNELWVYHNTGNGTETGQGAFVRLVNADIGLPSGTQMGIGIIRGGLLFDYDNDADLDLFVGGETGNKLFRNISPNCVPGSICFEDATAESCDPDPDPFCASFTESELGSIVAGDINNDGYLDLYTSYGFDGGLRLFLNIQGPTGQRVFDDITGVNNSGVFGETASWQAMMADLNEDGWIDIVQACDGCPEKLWINQGDNTFVDEGILSGLQDASGTGTFDMGVTIGDYDNDQDLDIYITNVTGCSVGGSGNSLFRNDPPE